ncbi:double-stranded RNA-binding protein 1-like [Senna tora]|uniref:Double-stranded RNA-binding protein 1-like n=1 Tax=Senna tora TaxID=362788 RepID=A0A834U3U0_9FABA|nr:double-stranded RNA-binding protein 1-like [Senna tora]
MHTNEEGVSNCYVFKSRLQEYAQKVGFPTPVYETIKEGPSHEPSFRSTVIVNDIRYDSLPGFFNRKAAEQSAAEVALVELAKSGQVNQSINQPVHETGLCKNLLQEYAQKMNYAIPLYLCKKDERPGRLSLYSCTVEIGGIRYIGASARTKKEAEIKAARTALLAIQSSASQASEKQSDHSKFTVIPCKKRGAESVAKAEASKVLKAKKARFKRRKPKCRQYRDKKGRNSLENTVRMGANMNHEVESHAKINYEPCIQTVEPRPVATEGMKKVDDGMSVDYQNEQSMLARECSFSPNSSKIFENGKSTELQSNESCVPTMESRPLAEEAMKKFGDGMSVDYPNEKGTLTGEGSLFLSSSSKSFANGKSTELHSNESCVQAAESRSFENGMPADYQNEKGTLAREGSLSLNSNKIFENGTSLQTNESCVKAMDSGPLDAEAMKIYDDGMPVHYSDEKGTLAGESCCL